jgi:AraC-like DNA-binding protein
MPAKKKMGRPKIEVDFEKIDALCAVFCNCKEIVSVLNSFDMKLSYDTVERRVKQQFGVTFAEYVEQKQMAFAKPKLRKAQFDCALSGNATMLIWLGKQYLEQVEKPNDGDMEEIFERFKEIDERLKNGTP